MKKMENPGKGASPRPADSVVVGGSQNTPFPVPVSREMKEKFTSETLSVRFSELAEEEPDHETVLMSDGTAYSTITLKFLGMKSFVLVDRKEPS